MANPRMFLVAALGLAASGACLVYNDSCPVTNPEVWGLISVDLDIRRPYVRQCEAPVGNFLADALLRYPYNLRDEGAPVTVRVGLINGGAIRDKVSCGESGTSRECIPRGPVIDQDLYQLLPFYEDSVVVVRLTGAQLRRVMERAVSSLGASGSEGQRGYYLHVAAERGVKVEVDCARQAQTLNVEGTAVEQVGQRVTGFCIGSQPCLELIDDASYYVATLDFVTGQDAGGIPNDGFLAFHEPGVVVLQTYLPVIDVVKYWLQSYQSTLGTGALYPVVEGRIAAVNCALPDCGISP
jgi:2',3'-cyclic-nucleotide 2'-phosphodiesterase (5'-nucleotidase family)